MSNPYEEYPDRRPDDSEEQTQAQPVPAGTPDADQAGTDPTYPGRTHPDQDYAEQGYSGQGHTEQGYSGQGHTEQGYSGQGYSEQGHPGWVAAEPAPPAQRWERGTSWATVAFGLVCMAVAGLALTFQLADVSVDWEVAGPATIVGLGALLVLVGLVGLLNGRSEETEQ